VCFEGVPAGCIVLVAACEEEPGVKAGKVLDGAVELRPDVRDGESRMDKAITNLVATEGSAEDAEGIGDGGVEDELGCYGGHGEQREGGRWCRRCCRLVLS
jgi:hypothetical protein